jgi:hypothetical protein
LRRIPVELPGFVGYIPGGASAADGRSPSPVEFHIAEPGSFFGTGVGRANPKYFPENFPTPTSPATDLSWCNTEILGIRSTSNGNAIDYPIYFCRANN